MRDLVALSALPAMWGGRAPAFIAGSLLDALTRILHPDIACVRLINPGGDVALEDWRPEMRLPPPALVEALDRLLAPGSSPTTLAVSGSGSAERLCVSATSIGYGGELGVLLVGSVRPAFPTEEERVVINVAANQAATMLQRQRLEQQQRDLIAMVAHDLKNPLTTMKGYAQLLRRRGVYDERAVTTIVAQADRMEGLIDDLRDVARIDAAGIALHRCEVDLIPLVHGCVEDARTLTETHAIRFDTPPEPIVGRWDAGRLAQVIANLLHNAVKYSPDGGVIRVQMAMEARAVRVAVSDEGIGMTPEVAGRIFERFYRAESGIAADRKGLGLGLYISKALVEAQGGQITVRSSPGTGSTFVVTLPLTVT